MALTKVTGSVIKDSVSLSGNVSVGGTLTYQDVTNVDALGIGTFRTGINVSGGQIDVGSNIKIGNAGIITATELDISGDIDVDGHTNLDNLSVAGITTFNNNASVTGNFGASGNISLSGSFIMPDSLLHANDTTTRIRFPGPGTFSVDTSGSERLRITSAGAVGINTTVTAATKLQVQSDGTSTTVGGNIVARFQSNGSGRDATIQLSDNVANSATISMLSSALVFKQSGTETLRITSGGHIGMGGNTNPTNVLHIKTAVTNTAVATIESTATNSYPFLRLKNDAREYQLTCHGGLSDAFTIYDGTSSAHRLVITSDGKLLLGHTAALTKFHGPASTTKRNPHIQVNGTHVNTASMSLTSWDNNVSSYYGPALFLAKSGSSTIGTNSRLDNPNSILGSIIFSGDDGDEFVKAAMIQSAVDDVSGGQTGNNDMPGRLMFFTTADGAQVPTERIRITSEGYSKHSNDGTYDTYTHAIQAHQFRQSLNKPTLWCSNSNSSHTWEIIRAESARTNNSGFHFFTCTSGNLTDDEFRVRGDGQVYADGSFNSGGADYAEYFEWTDGNSSNEDRRGMTVVLDGNKVKLSTSSDSTDNIIGVVSGNASVIGDAASEKWTDKYLKDDYGTYQRDENGERKLNPSYNDTKTYVSREDRQEWDAIGMVGKLRIRKGQTTGTRWIKMRDISDTVQEWLVR